MKTNLLNHDTLRLFLEPNRDLSPYPDLRRLTRINHLSAFLIGDTTVYLAMSGDFQGELAGLKYSGNGGLIYSYSATSGLKIAENAKETVDFTIGSSSNNRKNVFMAGKYFKRLFGNDGGADVDQRTNYEKSFILQTEYGGIQNDPFPRFSDNSWIQAACIITRTVVIQNTNGYMYSKGIGYDTTRITPNISSKTFLATALAADMRERYYISAHQDSTLRLWTPGIPNVFKRIQLLSPVTTIAVSPDSVHFATAHTDGTVACWNIDSLAYYAITDSVFTPYIQRIFGYNPICAGENAQFEVEAQSNFGEELSYQWKKDGGNLIESDSVQGVHSAKLVLKNVKASDAGQYVVNVRSVLDSQLVSSLANLMVQASPVLKMPLSKEIINVGPLLVVFHAKLIDSLYAQYQWLKDNIEIPGATMSQYYFDVQDSLKNAGEYNVRISNLCGETLSNSVKVGNTVGVVLENPFKTSQFSIEPNPFKNSTTIHFSLEKPLKIKLAVTDILGREVAVLKDEMVQKGEQNVVFKNENLPDGIYFVTLLGDNGMIATQQIVMKR